MYNLWAHALISSFQHHFIIRYIRSSISVKCNQDQQFQRNFQLAIESILAVSINFSQMVNSDCCEYFSWLQIGKKMVKQKQNKKKPSYSIFPEVPLKRAFRRFPWELITLNSWNMSKIIWQIISVREVECFSHANKEFYLKLVGILLRRKCVLWVGDYINWRGIFSLKGISIKRKNYH